MIEHQVIKTTVVKAKELRRVIEPLITHAKKNDSVAGRRHAFDTLRSKAAVKTLFDDIAPRAQHRNGGYVRILKCGFRTGDKAPMAFVELVDREDALVQSETSTPAASEPVVSETVAPAKTGATIPEADAGIENPVEAAVEAVNDGKFDAAAAKAALGKTIKQDDLTIIEGIGPKIAEIFAEAGIETWAKLAETDAERLKEILNAAGDRYKMHDPSTWSRQAEMAANGQWVELAEWQDQLDGGREAE